MPNDFFRFKQFTIFHDRCAMKVGTDGVLLGAWAEVDGCNTVLDVGTGSGLIALMMAQRNSFAEIRAIEIDENAALQAKENAEKSPFAQRVEVLLTSFQDFATSETRKFDLIVSNPPFFVQSLQSPDRKRTFARHADSLSASELFSSAKKLLTQHGKLAVIYPFSEAENVKQIARNESLYLSRETVVFPTPEGNPKRVLLEFCAAEPQSVLQNELVIEQQRHVYSDDFIRMVKDFYLHL